MPQQRSERKGVSLSGSKLNHAWFLRVTKTCTNDKYMGSAGSWIYNMPLNTSSFNLGAVERDLGWGS